MRSRFLLWVDHTHGFNYSTINEDLNQRRRLILRSLNKSGFGWQIVFVAGFGFLADAYDIFSINTILPMISIVYFENDLPSRYRLGLNLATLLGSMVGQVVLGYYADRLGRRKVYGLELAFTIVASLGLATASNGAFNSMSLMGLLIFWRAVMGIGIGSDYPLSAVLTAEFAPTEHRDTMLAAVFLGQPLGQLLAVLIAFATTAGWRRYVADVTATSGALSCSMAATTLAGMECARTVDRAWRMTAGLGAIPALIAIYFRFTIPESVYYTLDVKENSDKAIYDSSYFGSLEDLDAFEEEQEEEEDHDDITEAEHPQHGNGAPTNGTQPNGQHVNVALQRNAVKDANSNSTRVWFRGFFSWLKSSTNFKDLFATSFNWMLLDFTFYLLGVNSSAFVPTLFGENNGKDRPPYDLLISQERHIMESSTAASLVGGLCAIALMRFRSSKPFLSLFNSPRRVQIWGFGALAILFVIIGAMYIKLPTTNQHVAIVVFYALAQFFFDLGPNTTTFIIPAQLFPTKYRCFCYGIAAAFGKLGSVLGQTVVNEVTSNNGLGGTLIGFALVMLLGALSSWYITPETCDTDGKSLSLEDLAKGNGRRRSLMKKKKKGQTLKLTQPGGNPGV